MPRWRAMTVASRSKYHAKPVNAQGTKFDSRKEYRRWQELQLLERAGNISNLRRQVKYTLIPAQREPDITGPKGGVKRGKIIEHPCTYTADFVYDRNGKEVVEDCKGYRTDVYRIKRKLMLYIHGIRILET